MLEVPRATCYAGRMLRLAILVGLLSACGSSTRGPAWPKSAGDGSDGGESIAPRKSSPLAVKDVEDDVVTVDTPAEKPAIKPSTTDDKPAETPRPTTPTVTAPDDIINVDDLVIEIDD